MKQIKQALIIFLLSLIVFGCRNQIEIRNNEGKVSIDSNNSITVLVNIQDGYSRTATPTFEWDLFNYDMAIYREGEQTPFATTKKTVFSNYRNGAVSVPSGKYRFVLTGYNKDNDNKVIQGEASLDLTTIDPALVDSSKNGVNATFRMYPVENSTGSVKITVNLTNVVDVIKGVKVRISSSPYGTDGVLTELPINSVSAVFSKTGLPSAKRQYAVFYFYDSKGNEVLSYPESLMIYPGLESTSEIKITKKDLFNYAVSLVSYKDDNPWSDIIGTVSLVDDNNYEYTLTQSQNVYSGTVPEGIYKVFVNGADTGLTFNSINENERVDFYTLVFNPGKGVILNGSADPSEEILVEGTTYNYSVDFVNGYERSNNFTVNGNITAESSFTYTINTTSVITTSAASPKEYNITYNIDGGTWQSIDGYVAPVIYTVENYDSIVLPTLEHLRKDGKILDGWTHNGEAFAQIPQGTTGDLQLTAKWKDYVSVDEKNKTIYANGISLIVQWNDSKTETNVYVDFNNNGIVDSDDQKIPVSGSNFNFNDYYLKAENHNGTYPTSNFTFTVKGGRIASLVGLGANRTNVSTVNISGETIIGNSTTGIDLPSLTNECVNITGQMSGNYSITLLSGNEYNNQTLHIIANINDPNYAQVSNFTCLKKNDISTELGIGIMDYKGKKIIYLTDPNPVSLPSGDEEGGIIWIDENNKTEFMLGDSTNIQIPCSVFSLSVKKGKFQLLETASLLDENDNPIETRNLARISDTKYTQTLQIQRDYYYIHMFSTSNRITAESVTEFIKTIKFIKDSADTDIELTVNLETMPYELINEMKLAYGDSKFDYYDGSFYLGVNESLNWIDAYNAAKQKVFNGLNGYLITITSQIENNYINSEMGLGQAWTGGSRIVNSNGYDASVMETTSTNGGNYFIWQCGPEAGKVYWKGKTYSEGNGKTTDYANWQVVSKSYPFIGTRTTYEPNNNTNEACMHFRSDGTWNDFTYNNNEVTSYIVEFRPYTSIADGEIPKIQKANYPAINETKLY